MIWHRGWSGLVLALSAGFCLGVFVDGWLRTANQPWQAAPASSQTVAQPTIAAVPGAVSVPIDRPPTQPANAAVPEPVVVPNDPPAKPTPAPVPVVAPSDRPTTRLRMPIDGILVESFRGGFVQLRGSRLHDAVDIMVPRGTPIHAVQAGTIAKLFVSRFGGITIYHFEEDGQLCFYYAHLERYADGLHEGQRVSQGEVIGYVGSSGNASAAAPHLHFEIHELDANRNWWQGRALDPYLVFKHQG